MTPWGMQTSNPYEYPQALQTRGVATTGHSPRIIIHAPLAQHQTEKRHKFKDRTIRPTVLVKTQPTD